MKSNSKKTTKRNGRPRLSATELAARGSRRAKFRAAEEAGTPEIKKPRRKPEPKYVRPSEGELLDLIMELPGYDPHRDAEGCWFDYKAAQKVIEFFETKLHHVEGAVAGQLFKLQPWQKGLLANLFGWKRTDDDGREVRRYRECLLFTGRKQGKSPLASGICLYLLVEDGEEGAQIVSAAGKREQAALVFRHCRGMVLRSEYLNAKAQIFGGIGQRSIVLRDDPGASFQSISADAATAHGLNLSAAVVDELHALPNRDLVDALQTAMASANRAQPLMVFITTADYARESICNEKHDYACKVRDGVIFDPAFLPAVYEVPRDLDWTDPEVWRLANPNLGVSVSREYLERECKRAQETPTYENTFRRLHLNQQTETDVRWLPMDKWDAGAPADPVAWRADTLERLAGQQCVGGLDLSTTTDITALVLAFKDDGATVLLPWFWIPKENAEQRERRDRVPYLTWARQGFLTLTDGNVTDYDVVRRDIGELGKRFNISKIAADRWNASQLLNQLQVDGFDVYQFGQGMREMSPAAKEFERLLIGGELVNGGNPVLRWMARNAAAETDAAGNIKPSKKKSTDRIDGIVAACMAVGVIGQIDETPTWGILV
jgi:phage terminase large subunit-like protein